MCDLINTLRPRQNGRHFADNIFKCIFLNGNVWIPIKISMNFVPKGPMNNNTALVQIMAWHRQDDKPLSEPMMVVSPIHICVARPQWVRRSFCHCRYTCQHAKHKKHDNITDGDHGIKTQKIYCSTHHQGFRINVLDVDVAAMSLCLIPGALLLPLFDFITPA